MTQASLENRIAIVTGASAGIGTAVARMLGDLGASVVVNARRKDRVDAFVSELHGSGIRASGVVGDAADQRVIEAMLDAARDLGGEVDLVVVNAGRGLAGSVLTSDETQWEGMIRTNLLAAARLVRSAGARMLREVEGAEPLSKAWDIVVIGSNVGKNVSPYSSMYGSTKFAAGAIAEGARRELGPKGIRVTLVAPGFVESEFQGVAGYDPEWFRQTMQRVGPALRPDDVARLVAFVSSQPPGVHINDVVIRPTRQEYP